MKFNLTAILVFSFVLGSGITLAQSTDTPTPAAALTAAATPSEGYHGVAWGTLSEAFQSSQNSSPEKALKRTEVTAIAYLLMNFHEVAENSHYRSDKLSTQKIEGDKTHYVFYDGRYCLAAVPIGLSNLNAVRKEIESKYPKKELTSYTTQWEYSDTTGYLMMEFDYQRYDKSPGTRVYLITASSYYQDQGIVDQLHYGDNVEHTPGSKTAVSAYLIYVSEDYFNNTDNAWTDYQAVQTTTAAPAVEIRQSPTPTDLEKKEKNEQQDLNSVE